MSIDPQHGLGRSAAVQRYRRLLVIVFTVLLLTAGSLTAFSAVQGPRLRGAQLNDSSLVERVGQRIILDTTQILAQKSAAGVTVDPAADFETVITGSQMTLRFSGILEYNQDYVIRVPAATGAATGASSSLEYRFSTSDTSVYALFRHPDDSAESRDDEILKMPLSAGGPEAVFSAARIQEFAVFPQMLAVAILNDDDTNNIVLSAGGGITSNVALPRPGVVTQLHSSGASNILGFTFSDPGLDGKDRNILYFLDLTGTGVPQPVLGLDGQPLSVSDWTFVPGTTSIIAQSSADRSLFLVDLTKTELPTPLGQHATLRGFVPGTTTLIVEDPGQISTINLSTGTVETLTLPEPTSKPGEYPGQLVILDQSHAYAQVYSSYDLNAKTLTSVVAVTDASGTKILYTPASKETRIGAVCLSPNGQYLAVETTSPEGILDLYPHVMSYTATQVSYIDVKTGESQRGLNGFLPDWCA